MPNKNHPSYSLFYALKSLTFILSIYPLLFLSHVMIFVYFDGNTFDYNPVAQTEFGMITFVMAILFVNFPTWLILQLLNKSSKDSYFGKDNIDVLSIFLLSVTTLIQIIFLVYQLLNFTLTLQTIIHTLTTAVIATLGYLIISSQPRHKNESDK